MQEHLFEKDILHCDKIDIQVLHEDGRDAQKNQKCGLYATGHTDDAIYLYDYKTTRSGKHAKTFLIDYKGKFIHTDGYSGYNAVSNVKIVCCMVHVHRQYTDALKALMDEESLSYTKSQEGVDYCNKLLKVESELADFSPEERYKKRQERLKPVLDDFFA